MATRFVALIAPSSPGIGQARASTRSALDRHPDLAIAVDAGGLLVATSGPPPLRAGPGVVIGALFRHGSTGAVDRFTAAEEARITESAGASLVDDFWGGWVAIMPDQGTSVSVLRAPFGELPCLFTQTGSGLALASDVAMLREIAGYRPEIDWDAVVWHLTARDLRFERTCLAGVSELHGGERLHAGTDLTIAPIWSPWPHAARNAAFATAGEAASAVRAATMSAVAARAGIFGRVTLMLSGGLDSSIVAAALGSCGVAFDCLSLTTRDRAGDERAFAEMTAQALGRPLHTARRDVTRIDLGRSEAARLPRPVARAFAQESRRAMLALASRTGSQAIFGGGGGDNVFCSLQSGAPPADVLRTAGPGLSFFRAAGELSQLASVGTGAVIADAVKRAWLGKRAPLRPVSAGFLTDAAIATGRGAPVHPWLAFPKGSLPGKAGHVRLLAYASSYVESFDPEDELPVIAPLLAQPLVEACLRVPSWQWYARGNNRAVAREAFRSLLPEVIIDRRSKGSPESFAGEIFETRCREIAAMLLDGLLASHDIVDRTALEAALADPRPAHGTGFMRILELVDVEAWLRGWIAAA